ncbi:hypothetical protein ACQJBY_005249 [Aegilops geniculata]
MAAAIRQAARKLAGFVLQRTKTEVPRRLPSSLRHTSSGVEAEAKLERRSRGGDSPCPWRFRELPALKLHFCPLSIRSLVSRLVVPLCRSVEYAVLLVFVPYLGQFMSPSRLPMQPLVGVISRFFGCCGRLWWAAVVVCRCSGVSPCFCRCSVGVPIDASVACGISPAYVLLMCLYARIL